MTVERAGGRTDRIGGMHTLVVPVAPYARGMADMAVADPVHGDDCALLETRVIPRRHGMRQVMVIETRRGAIESLTLQEPVAEKMVLELLAAGLQALDEIAEQHLLAFCDPAATALA